MELKGEIFIRLERNIIIIFGRSPRHLIYKVYNLVLTGDKFFLATIWVEYYGISGHEMLI